MAPRCWRLGGLDPCQAAAQGAAGVQGEASAPLWTDPGTEGAGVRGLAVWQQASINLHASLLSLPIARCCSAALDHCLQAPPELPRTVSTELTKTSGLQTALQSRSQLQQPPSQPGTLSMMDLSVICWVHGHARKFVPSRHTALVMGRAVQDATEDMARFVHPPTALAMRPPKTRCLCILQAAA